ncbi:MAG: glycoside hydrolase, partial [Chloroflexi bacterium]
GLREHKKYKLAHQVARNHLEQVAAVFKETGTFGENYAPETTAPGNPAKKDFIGATGVSPISILLEHIIGVRADWPQRRVYWERLLDTDEPYGIKNHPLGPDGTVDLIGDATKITITTDTPFTLVMRDKEQSLQTAVPAGTTEIDLS